MSTPLQTLPESLDAAHTLIIQQATKIEQLESKLDWFMEQIRKAQHHRFGKSSEQYPEALQGNLFNEIEVLADILPAPSPKEEIEITYRRAKGKAGHREVLQDLPVKRIEYYLSEEELLCPSGHGSRHIIRTEVRSELIIVPAQAYIQEHVIHIYGCRMCEKEGTEVAIVKAPAPKPIIPKSLASPSALAQVMVMKYADGMPLYRIEKHFQRLDITISRSVLCNWMLKGAEWLVYIYEELKIELVKRKILAADETTVQVLHEAGRPAESKSYMWMYRTGGCEETAIVLFEYQMTRGGEHPRQFLKGFTGYLHVDGYDVYDKIPGVIPVGCWAHARRKFDEAIKALPYNCRKQPSKALEGLTFINELFLIEQKLKNCTPQVRKEQREIWSRPVVENFKAWLDMHAGAALPKFALGEAINYCRNQWPKLIRFLEDGRLELSNNRSERSIKPFVIGRKAWLFANTPRGARASAIIYSIIETAKENKVNPYEYLVYLLQQLPNMDVKDTDALRKLLPWNVSLPPANKASP